MKKLKKSDQVVVIGRRWFERVNGNTYHSVNVSVNGEWLDGIDFTYGYDSMYEQNALELLKKHYNNLNNISSLWRIKYDIGCKLISTVSDVQRRKDL